MEQLSVWPRMGAGCVWPDVEEQLRTSPVPLMGVNVEKPAESNPTYVAAGPLMVNTELLCKGQWTLEITNKEERLLGVKHP